MKNQYHILNGDALKDQFPPSLEGNVIVCRECLVDGDVSEPDLDAFYVSRAKFLSENYGGEEQEYYKKCVSEFQKIQQIEENAEINLWFEDDLFCQVNFWFVSSLLKEAIDSTNIVYLIRPKVHSQYGFGRYDTNGLLELYQDRIELTQIDNIADLWDLYRTDRLTGLRKAAEELRALPFLLPAVEAHIARIPSENTKGRPVASLIQIMKDINSSNFGPVFKEFSKRESIYGFGDLHVRKLFDEILSV